MCLFDEAAGGLANLLSRQRPRNRLFALLVLDFHLGGLQDFVRFVVLHHLACGGGYA